MNNLLQAGITRLRKNTTFLVGIIIMAVFGVYCPIMAYFGYDDPSSIHIEAYFKNYTLILALILAVFCSLFLGTEYRDGTIRNKLIVGHVRFKIYLSNLIFCIIAAFILLSAYILVTLGIGLPLIGTTLGFEQYVKYIALNMTLMIGLCSIFTFVSMTFQSKSIASIICLLGTFILLFIGALTFSRLEEPEYFEAYSYTDQDGITHDEPREKNSRYLTGEKRKIYEFFFDVNPGGQIIQYMNTMDVNNSRLPISSGIIAVIFTGAGIIIFNKKDIK